ncbi:hypothetical protein BDM02DRAFT_689397 [Thelephora ganbajun]|uniref:Uncharacterized protein n=1 Tax=Thelephora ganbajun TaxID=370292 RepID=A0ACB6Z6C7_THEGA|nr:hypothetical protein BDM02DRAFT_689397 [Thelephora ganbajun]
MKVAIIACLGPVFPMISGQDVANVDHRHHPRRRSPSLHDDSSAIVVNGDLYSSYRPNSITRPLNVSMRSHSKYR